MQNKIQQRLAPSHLFHVSSFPNTGLFRPNRTVTFSPHPTPTGLISTRLSHVNHLSHLLPHPGRQPLLRRLDETAQMPRRTAQHADRLAPPPSRVPVVFTSRDVDGDSADGDGGFGASRAVRRPCGSVGFGEDDMPGARGKRGVRPSEFGWSCWKTLWKTGDEGLVGQNWKWTRSRIRDQKTPGKRRRKIMIMAHCLDNTRRRVVMSMISNRD